MRFHCRIAIRTQATRTGVAALASVLIVLGSGTVTSAAPGMASGAPIRTLLEQKRTSLGQPVSCSANQKHGCDHGFEVCVKEQRGMARKLVKDRKISQGDSDQRF